MAKERPFWETTPLGEMSENEWESLCDGCGKCCLHKLQNSDTNEVFTTNVACRLLDLKSCRCGDYENRKIKVPDCVQLTPETASTLPWLPTTCAYRLLAVGESLPDWHPLVSGSNKTVHDAGVSVRGRAVPEKDATALTEHIVDWPDV